MCVLRIKDPAPFLYISWMDIGAPGRSSTAGDHGNRGGLYLYSAPCPAAVGGTDSNPDLGRDVPCCNYTHASHPQF